MQSIPKTSNQKLKLLYTLELFEKQSDEENVITLTDIQDYLEGKGVTAERKTVYDDIETLRSYGVDIIQAKKGYTT